VTWGSSYLGYVIATLMLASAHQQPTVLYVWLILGGIFFVDATVTLLRRLLSGQRIYQAHRSHAYQVLSRRWHSHSLVTRWTWLVNIAWLLPCAYWCVVFPAQSVIALAIALLPLGVLVLFAGAGRAEKP